MPRLNQPLYDKTQKKEALTDLYYNLGLLKEWKEGRLPLSKAGEDNYKGIGGLPKAKVLNPRTTHLLWFFQKHETRLYKDAVTAAQKAINATSAPQ